MISKIPPTKRPHVNPANLVPNSEFQLMKLVNAN